MSPNRFRYLLEKLNLKYLILVIPFAIFTLLSTVFTGYAAPIRPQADFSQINPPANISQNGQAFVKATPETQSGSMVAPVVVPDALLRQTSMSTETLFASGAIIVNQTIPDNDPSGITSTVEINEAMILSRVEVLFDIQHDAPDDLQIVLSAPSGLQTTLTPPQVQAAKLDNGLVRLVTSDYQGESPQGTWQVNISDLQRSTEGSFAAWNLVLWRRVHLVYLPIILKSPPLRFTPEGIMLLSAYRVDLSANRALSADVEAQVTLTPPQPTLDPGVTPAPTTGPGTPTNTPTPKATLTPTPTSTPEPILIPNGDFESSGVWRTFSLRGHDIIFDDDSDELPEIPIPAFSDSHAVWLGGDESEISYIETDVFIPFDRPFLFHQFYVYSVDPTCASDLFSDFTVATQFTFATPSTLNNLQSDVGGLIIFVNNNPVATFALDLCSENATSGWGTIVYNTFPFRGQFVKIQFKTISDSQATSGFFIDDVGLRSDIPSNFVPFGITSNKYVSFDGNPILTPIAIPRNLDGMKAQSIEPAGVFHKGP